VVLAGYNYRSTNVPVSMELESDAFENMQDMLSDVFSVAIARGVGAALVNGNGTTAPQGIVTGATAGPTSAATTRFCAESR
jgi:HK97 family phage major capsid protein